MSANFLGNFKVMGAIVAIVLFMLVIYGYSKKKPVNQGGASHIQGHAPQHLQEQQNAMSAYKRPNIGKSGGCGCGKK